MYLLQQNVSTSLYVSKNETLLSKRFIRRRFCKPPEKKVHISTFLLWPAHILDLYPPSPPSSKLLSLCWHKIETSLIFQKQRILTRHPLLVRRRKYNLSKLIFWHTPSQVKRKAALKSFHMDFFVGITWNYILLLSAAFRDLGQNHL